MPPSVPRYDLLTAARPERAAQRTACVQTPAASMPRAPTPGDRMTATAHAHSVASDHRPSARSLADRGLLLLDLPPPQRRPERLAMRYAAVPRLTVQAQARSRCEATSFFYEGVMLAAITGVGCAFLVTTVPNLQLNLNDPGFLERFKLGLSLGALSCMVGCHYAWRASGLREFQTLEAE